MGTSILCRLNIHSQPLMSLSTGKNVKLHMDLRFETELMEDTTPLTLYR